MSAFKLLRSDMLCPPWGVEPLQADANERPDLVLAVRASYGQLGSCTDI